MSCRHEGLLGCAIAIMSLQRQQHENAIAILNAQTTAGVSSNTSQLSQAKAAITIATRNLSAQLAGTKEYYTALAALHAAQIQLGNAQLAYSADLRKLNTDLTDPIAQARNTLADAQAKLAADIKSKQGPDVLTADRINVRSAQNQAESAAFSQRLSDAQIADRLGRSSHQAYLTYLQGEHNRLSNIMRRTRQQQDELNQIDEALQAANSQMQGQFNLGDIKVPTPYEVRKYIATVAGAATSGAAAGAMGGLYQSSGATTYSQNTIQINGADTAAVTAVLRQILGSSAVASATTTGRKN